MNFLNQSKNGFFLFLSFAGSCCMACGEISGLKDYKFEQSEVGVTPALDVNPVFDASNLTEGAPYGLGKTKKEPHESNVHSKNAYPDTVEDVHCVHSSQSYGMKMVYIKADQLPAYCIDETEVTAAQYRAYFELSPNVKKVPECSWLTTIESPEELSVHDAVPDAPITEINWCEAKTYCLSVGKDLCGAVDGQEGEQFLNDSWYIACSANGTRSFGYGKSDIQTHCNVGADASLESVWASERHRCEGAYPGLFHMLGNAREWLNSCRKISKKGAKISDGRQDLCDYSAAGIGGEQNFDCDSDAFVTGQGMRRDQKASWLGFRCCFYPQEKQD